MNKLDKTKQFQDRTKQFAVEVIYFIRSLPKNKLEARIMGKQLRRSATSVAAHYRAAYRGRSKKEFIAKLGIIVEEADESIFWLEMIRDVHLIAPKTLNPLLKEAREIVRIIVKFRQTAAKSLNH